MLEDHYRRSNIQLIKVPEKKNRDNKEECIIKETTQENFEELKIQVSKSRGPADCQTQ